MKKLLTLLALIPLSSLVQAAEAKEDNQKLADDPTRITTQMGVSYSDNYHGNNDKWTFSGSLAFDPVRKINVSLNEDASQWRVGGSWLFDVGIVNFNFGKNEFADGTTQTNYSVGTFMPLSYFGFTPGGFQIFPMAGYTYNDAEVVCDTSDTSAACFNPGASLDNPYVVIPQTSHSGYLGAFALRPLTTNLTFTMFGGGAMGSNDYSGYWIGGGFGYQVTDQHSLTAYTFIQDNSYGQEERFSLGYKYQFN
ncbi:hypothetical protein [Vibrio ulleungensis]|uniref:Outer membrane protein beta-barrel domain-containing protein n=1 Tax=Vibrio ulleungensis TaxID=2807619 RepID=A0ABS2HBX5_9VIBR|nr:hypothetical protein [Vibrio ulleungensis]MBM7035103.1 hypothetical protein [Vibrio ulleungensis]